MLDLSLYRENKQLKKRVAELENKIKEYEINGEELLIQSLNLYLQDKKLMDDFFKFIRKTDYFKCTETKNILLERWNKND